METIASLQATFPEFAASDPVELQAAIDFAEATTSDTWAANRRGRVVLLNAAVALTVSPAARDVRSKADKPNRYLIELRRLQKQHAAINPLRVGAW